MASAQVNAFPPGFAKILSAMTAQTIGKSEGRDTDPGITNIGWLWCGAMTVPAVPSHWLGITTR